MIDAALVRKLITIHIGTNPHTQRKMLDGEIEVDLVPQGTLAERIWAGASDWEVYSRPPAWARWSREVIRTERHRLAH